MNKNYYLQLLQVLKRSSVCFWMLVCVFLMAGEMRANVPNELIAKEATTACGVTVWGCNDKIGIEGMGTATSEILVLTSSGDKVFHCDRTWGVIAICPPNF